MGKNADLVKEINAQREKNGNTAGTEAKTNSHVNNKSWGDTFKDIGKNIGSLFESKTPEQKAEDEKNAKGMEKAKAEQAARSERNKQTPEEQQAKRDRLASPDYQMDQAQRRNRALKGLTDEQMDRLGVPKEGRTSVYDPGDSDGDGKAVSPEDGNLYEGAPKSAQNEDEDPWKDTKAAWDHLTSVFGDKVSALQNELEGRLGEMTTPTERETGNPFAGDDVPASKEMNYSDMKGAIQGDIDDAKAVLGGVADIGMAGAETAGTAMKDAGKALAHEMGYDSKDLDDAKQTLKDVGSIGKSLSGLGGLFATDNSNGDSKVPDGNWKPKSINDLFK